jgi:lipopolysaccharide transport system ATP-binding protein
MGRFSGSLGGTEQGKARCSIYLSGAVLGMKKAEIERKFDEIVAFAEIENFMDTPVKRYSSGMYVRLAFAVAAHLEPEILIVDEVLAVGDIEFQKKCLGRMGEVAKEGRTVLFVSHNMGAIDRLCERSLWVDRGRVVFDGASVDAIRMYQSQHSATSVEWRKLDRETDDREFSFLTIAAKDQGGQPNSVFRGNEPVRVEIEYVVHRWLQACQIGIRVQNSEGVVIFGTEDVDGSKSPDLTKDPGHYRAAFTIPANFLAPGRYSLFIGAHWPYRKWYEIIEQAIIFDISASGSLASDGRKGMVSPLIKWENSKISGS